jgi:hypothetical protein
VMTHQLARTILRCDILRLPEELTTDTCHEASGFVLHVASVCQPDPLTDTQYPFDTTSLLCCSFPRRHSISKVFLRAWGKHPSRVKVELTLLQMPLPLSAAHMQAYIKKGDREEPVFLRSIRRDAVARGIEPLYPKISFSTDQP